MRSDTLESRPFCGALEARHRDYLRAYERGDADALIEYFTPDAAMIEPDKTPIRGRGGIADALHAWFARFTFSNGRVELWECGGDDAAAWDLSYFELQARRSGSGERFAERWKQLSLWQRAEDGGWLMHRLMFNSHRCGDP